MAMVKRQIVDFSIQKIPFLRLVIPYCIGIACSQMFFWNAIRYTFLYSILISVIACFIMAFFFRKQRIFRGVYFFMFYSFSFLIGVWQIVRELPNLKETHFSRYTSSQLEGIIIDEPVVKQKTIRFPLSVTNLIEEGKYVASEGKIMVTVLRDSSLDQSFNYGDHVAISNTFDSLAPPYNPEEFNYKAYLQNRNIWHQSLLEGGDYVMLGERSGNKILSFALALREKLVSKFRVFIKHEEAYHVAIALIFGSRSQLDAATLDAFTNTGTIHVLSVSGLHVGLVFGFLTVCLGWIDRFPYGRFIRCFIILLCVWAYVILTGMAPPILRAGIMITFFLFSVGSGRRQNGLNTLAASAFFILLFQPKYLFDVGFQLSYLAITGILIFHPILKRLYKPRSKYLSWVVEYSYVSLAAQLFTLPAVLYYFGQFPTYFLFANLFIALPSTIIMYLGLGLSLIPFHEINSCLGEILAYVIRFSLYGLKWFDSLPVAAVKGISWAPLEVLLAFLMLIFLIYALNYRNKQAFKVLCMMLFMLSILTSFQAMEKMTYKGIAVYNLRSALGVATIHNGNVALFSSLDSLNHPTLRYSVLPHLRQYAREEEIKFYTIPPTQRNNYMLSLGSKKILVLEKKLNEIDLKGIDVVLWRKNNYNVISEVKSQTYPSLFLFDGSNSDKTLSKIKLELVENINSSYFLKNNFAYVWEEQ
ncbi:ComEC family competence protein [Sphingobacterium alkalisoli]|uniref:ComEC family competence protein n=1 Tax=Sphingobacterium alkalisoli TaxID=1874115 RepID=A0A4U0GQR0_9SPHI|nr:ComEC/Rec2 family competence protein [Sphingobacterium alkalisoli]TJY60744.1 ComEC family competence protein [Sphingobacterium alkalisoli]